MTSPFILANRPKTLGTDADQTPAPVSGVGIPRADTPAPDMRQKWQVVRDETLRKQNDRQSADTINPVADTIPQSDYMARFGPIKAIGDIAAAGQISSSENQRAQAALDAANAAAAARDAAINSAYQNSANMIGGVTSSYSGTVNYDGSDSSLADMMRKAGFPDSAIGVGLAVIQAESGGRANAINSANKNGSIDSGLFQINSIHSALYKGQNILDPQTNVNIAFQVWNQAGRSWKPWVTYNNGVTPHAVPPSQLQVTAVPSTNGGVFANSATGALRNQVIQASLQVLNIPYVWGGSNMATGVDCSGLVQQVYKQVLGLNLAHSAATQAQNGYVGTRVANVNQLQPGDLVAFQWAGGYKGAGQVSHIAIYAGNGKIIEAAGGAHGDTRSLGNSQQDRGAIFIHVKYPGE